MTTSSHLPSLSSVDNGGGVNGGSGGSNHSSYNSRNSSVSTNGSSGHSASLRGNFHSRVPDIPNQPLHTLLPVVKDGWLPPEPYYITQNVVYVECPIGPKTLEIYSL